MGGRCVLSLLVLLLLLGAVACPPIAPRARRDFPLDFEALAEIPVEHNGLVDDYGVPPKHPSLSQRVIRERSQWLTQAGKSKRDEPDIGELYYDDVM